jgi:hypothetical protein
MTTITEKTSDYLTTDELKRLSRYFQKEQNFQMALLIEFGFRTLLRYSDISRFIWENNGHSDEYLIKLSSILNHSSTSITRRYLGISREEIKDIYQSFDELM